MTERLDRRREAALRNELLRRATAVFGARADAIEPGEIMDAILGVAARIGEEVTSGIAQVPQKQASNFYAAMGIGRSPATPATLPVSIRLANGGPTQPFLPAGSKLQADTGAAPVIFETVTGVDLVDGGIVSLCAIDAAKDQIFLAPGPARAPSLPYRETVSRRLASGVAPGATVVQIEPATGLVEGAVLRIGKQEHPEEHTIEKVEDDVVTISPPLGATFQTGDRVVEVTAFTPWSGARDHQSHDLYLGHATLLDIPSAAMIFVSGLTSTQRFDWFWFGKTDDAETPDWKEFHATRIDADGRWVLEKLAGKFDQTAIAGNSAFWIRAKLPAGSDGPEIAKSIRLAVAGDGVCAQGEVVDPEKLKGGVDYEAVAVTTPVVGGKPFYAFGREPRLYDSFYIGCREAFGKARAKVWLSFQFGDAELGRMSLIDVGGVKQVFAVGTDGLLYRAVLGGKAFDLVPMPHELNGEGVPSQAPVAARVDKGVARLALAGKGCVFEVSFNPLEPLAEGKLAWRKLTSGAVDSLGEAVTLHLASVERLLTLWRTIEANGEEKLTLLDWNLTTSVEPSIVEGAIDLIPVQGADAALVVVERDLAKLDIAVIGDTGAPRKINDMPAHQLPRAQRAAWASTADQGKDIYTIGGYSDVENGLGNLHALRVSPLGVVIAEGEVKGLPLLPITFEPPYSVADWPVAVIATPEPARIQFDAKRPFRKLADDVDIGASANPARHFFTSDAWTIVQHPDRGLFARQGADEGHSLRSITLNGDYRLVVDAHVLPDGAALLANKARPKHVGFEIVELPGGESLLRPFDRSDALSVNSAEEKWKSPLLQPLEFGPGGGDLVVENSKIDLGDAGTTAHSIRIHVETTDPQGGVKRSIWTLNRRSRSTKWTKPRTFPTTPGLKHRWRPLLTIDDEAGRPIEIALDVTNTQSWFETRSADFAELVKRKATRSLYNGTISVATGDAVALTTTTAFRLPLSVIDRGDRTDVARFRVPAPEWGPLGPNQPANPDLSWEYWNGSTWWALDAQSGQKFHDATADLQSKGSISFNVPRDLSETEVGGRKNCWIRARLIGGDYGQARITIDVDGDDKHSTQSVTRDLSAIRSPYVTRLQINYCAMDARFPERVITEDNLGSIDQTNANEFGLPVRFFSPVATALRPVAPQTPPQPGGDAACCELWTTPPAPAQTTPATQPPDRVVMIGFDAPPVGDAVSIFVDAAGHEAKLKAFAFRRGNFSPIDIVADDSLGMSEPGVILLGISEPLDLSQFFGVAAYWIALGPADAARWSPRLRGVYLNGVMSTSVETRSLESIGASTGAPDQRFRLVAAPIDPASLDLWVAEPVGGEEAARLGAEMAIAGLPGPWVRWTQVEEFPSRQTTDPARAYVLDPETGEVMFGDGRNARVPPMGGAILARSYRHVTGEAANGVGAGATLQPISPIAGVETVLALDGARGGVDAETSMRALARAPAKLRSGDRLTTLADLEEYLTANLRWVAQARAANRRGRIRLIVAGRDEKLTPAPSSLRGVREMSMAERKCARWRRKSVPVRFREKGRAALFIS